MEQQETVSAAVNPSVAAAVPVESVGFDVEDFIAGLSGGADAWRVTVYRQRGPKREFLATLAVEEDLLESVRAFGGPGDYALDFRQGGKVKRRAQVSIAALPDWESELEESEPAPMPVAAPVVAPVPAPVPVAAPVPVRAAGMSLADAVTFGRQLKELQALFGPAAPVQPQAAQPDPLQNAVAQLAMLRELKDTTQDLFGPQESGVGSFLTGLVKMLAPAVGPVVSAVAAEMMKQQQPQRAQVPVQNPGRIAKPQQQRPKTFSVPLASDLAANDNPPKVSEAEAEGEADAETAETIAIKLADKMTRNEVTGAIELLEKLAEEMPDLAENWDKVLSVSGPELRKYLAENVPNGGIVGYVPHFDAWAQAVQAEGRRRDVAKRS